MVFSSITFLFYFLPLVLFFYFLFRKKAKNFVLLIFSLFFYFYGETKYIIVLIFSCVFNYWFGKLIEKNRKYAKIWLIINLICNLGILIYFKYFNFFLTTFNQVFDTSISLIHVVMPIGISFFTFQAISYTIDIYRGKVNSANSLWDFATYLSLFPQLIAGPIVRYQDVSLEITHRIEKKEDISRGIQRFIIGLAKKILLANMFGEALEVFTGIQEVTLLSTWLSAIAITFQLYFDFSGYSDMAIGLGLIFGFHFLENFNYPLIAKSITDFWRRWHISLSSWFKDYIYIPLGGNRVSRKRQYLNILIVWLLTGLWHGANWNFVLWGGYFAVFLILEKTFFHFFLDKHSFIAHIYTFLLIIVSFVIFHFEDLTELTIFLRNMFGFGNIPFWNQESLYYFRSYVILFGFGILAMMPFYQKIIIFIERKWGKNIVNCLEITYYFLIFVLSIAFLIDESFNPFLYFRF